MTKRNKYGLVAVVALSMLGESLSARAALFNTQEILDQSDEFALNPVFDPVGLLTGSDANGDSFIAGSGVLIDPFWVLTAGHVPQDNPGIPWEAMQFNPSAIVGENLDRFVEADLWLSFPGYTSDIAAGRGNDIGLVRLSEPILDVTPARRFFGEDQFGIEFLAAGFGNPGVWPNAPEEAFDGVRRGGQNTADRTLPGTVEDQYWLADFDQFQPGDPFPLEWQASKNDSGGGWFAEIGEETLLIGIHSFSRGNFVFSGATRVSLYNDWIDTTIAAHSVPEPTSAVFVGPGLIVWLGMRRLRRRRQSSCFAKVA